jgi:hypothetical protein
LEFEQQPLVVEQELFLFKQQLIGEAAAVCHSLACFYRWEYNLELKPIWQLDTFACTKENCNALFQVYTDSGKVALHICRHMISRVKADMVTILIDMILAVSTM